VKSVPVSVTHGGTRAGCSLLLAPVHFAGGRGSVATVTVDI
jgi:hypothetical protein